MNTDRSDSTKRFGYTLVELLVATGVSSLLVVALPTTIFIASQSLNTDFTTAQRASTAQVQSNVINDLRLATQFNELTANAVTVTVPDRDGNGEPEMIRYSWSGVAGDPLMYQYNNGTAVSFIDDVHQFDLSSITRTISAPVIPDPEVINNSSEFVFGNDVQYGNTNEDLVGKVLATKVTLSEAGFLQSITAYLDISNLGAGYYLGIYSDKNGKPKNLLAASIAGTETGQGWKTLTLPETDLKPGTYWLAVVLTDTNQSIYYEEISDDQYAITTTPTNQLISAWSKKETFFENRKISIYGSYTLETQSN